MDNFKGAAREADGVLARGDLSVRLLDSPEQVDGDVSQSNLPIVCVDEHPHFDRSAYFDHLGAKSHGRCVLFCDVITSSMPLVDM